MLPKDMRHIDLEVVDASGTPIPGLQVALLDGTPAGAERPIVEGMASGAMEAGERPPTWILGGDGQGRIWPLADRTYALRVLSRERGVSADLGPVRPLPHTQRFVVDLAATEK